MASPVLDFFRCPAILAETESPAQVCAEPGYFAFGSGITCYGQLALSGCGHLNGVPLPDLYNHVSIEDSLLRLPFDAAAIVDNLRLERYPMDANTGIRRLLASTPVRQAYYSLSPAMPGGLRQILQRYYFRDLPALAFLIDRSMLPWNGC